MQCPICKKPVRFDDPEMPFCSKRCRTLDLANWATEKYAIPAEEQEFDVHEGDADDLGIRKELDR